MLKTILIVLSILTLLLIVLIDYAACVVAGWEDWAMEGYYEKWKQDHDSLSVPAEMECCR